MIRISTVNPSAPLYHDRRLLYLLKWGNINGNSCLLIACIPRKSIKRYGGFKLAIRKELRKQLENAKLRLFEKYLKGSGKK